MSPDPISTEEYFRGALKVIAHWSEVDLSGEWETGLRGVIRSITDMAREVLSAHPEKPSGCDPCNWPDCGCQYNPGAAKAEPSTVAADLDGGDARPNRRLDSSDRGHTFHAAQCAGVQPSAEQIEAIAKDYAQRWYGDDFALMDEDDKADLRIEAQHWLKCWFALAAQPPAAPVEKPAGCDPCSYPDCGCQGKAETVADCICQDQHRRGYCTEPGCPYSTPAPQVKTNDEIDYDDPKFNQGVQHVVELLSKTLGVDDWVAGDGSEDYDCDLEQTLLNILAAKGLYKKDDGEFASFPPHSPSSAETDGQAIASIVSRLRNFAVWNNRHSHYEPVPLCKEAADLIERISGETALKLLESQAQQITDGRTIYDAAHRENERLRAALRQILTAAEDGDEMTAVSMAEAALKSDPLSPAQPQEAPQNGAVPERETFWLLEMVGHQKYALYTSQRAAFVHSWTEDVWQAGRFDNERHAHEVWRMLDKQERARWRPVEHMFINKLDASPSVSQSQRGGE